MGKNEKWYDDPIQVVLVLVGSALITGAIMWSFSQVEAKLRYDAEKQEMERATKEMQKSLEGIQKLTPQCCQ